MSTVLPHQEFQRCLNQKFRVTLEAGSGDLELVEVEPLQQLWARPDGLQSYILVFLWRHEIPLPQSLYDLEHTRLGRVRMFLSPMGPDPHGRGLRYQAVFN